MDQHLFFSYAHKDDARLIPIHARLELVTEHNIWIDKIGLERGIEWENAIKLAIETSYGVIFAITKNFVDAERAFIHDKEIPWAIEHCIHKQGPLLFALRFDDVPLPPALKLPPYECHVIDVFKRDLDDVFAELKRELPQPKPGGHPFVMAWPRLSNFKGRDKSLLELHEKLIVSGKTGVVGLHGTGGIGKTQLAVEYAHRYRFYYPAGVYWLNAAQDWRKEIAACADQLGLKAADPTDTERDKQMVIAFKQFLAEKADRALLVLDNVHDPAEAARREIIPKLTAAQLAEQTAARLMLTTRVTSLPPGFDSVQVDILKPLDARAVLLDPRPAETDLRSLDEIARLMGYLPLALGWMAAALRAMPDLTPAELLDELKAQGVDAVIGTLAEQGVELGTPEYHDKLVSAVLTGQIKRLNDDALQLLALTAAYGEVAAVPLERLRLLSGLEDKGLKRPFATAVKNLQTYSLVETLEDGAAFRLHPLTQKHVETHLDAPARLNAAAPRLTTAYRTPEIIAEQTRTRGFADLYTDLAETLRSLTELHEPLEKLFRRIFSLEEHKMRFILPSMRENFAVQQLRDRAHHEGDDSLRDLCDRWLAGQRHFQHNGPRYPASGALLRILADHSGWVTGALELRDGRLLSWSNDGSLHLWSSQGQALTTLEGHTDAVTGALELRDGRLLSWAEDTTLRLWSSHGQALTTLEGHTGVVRGALELLDGRLLSWAEDIDALRLWSSGGIALTTLQGHTGVVRGALELRDGRLLSWSGNPIPFGNKDNTLRLWSIQGRALAVFEGHTRPVNGALELHDGRLLSWSIDRTLRLWSSQGQALTTFEGHTDAVMGALELRDGRLLSWSADGTLRLWSSQGQALTTLEGHTGPVNGALELRNGRLLSWSGDDSLRLWSSQGQALTTLEGHTGPVNGALELRDGRLLSWSGDDSLRLWSSQGLALTTLEGHTGPVNGALELGDGRLLSWSNDGKLHLWEQINSPGQALLIPEGHGDTVHGALELRDGRLLLWSNDGSLRLWSSQGQALLSLEGHTNTVNGALEMRDGRLLSWSNDGSLRLWSSQGQALITLEDHTRPVNGALEMRDGRLLSWSNDGSLRLWSSQGQALITLEGHHNTANGALELRDGRLLSWSGDDSLRLWSSQGLALITLEGHNNTVNGALELRDGRILSWGANPYGRNVDTLRLWTSQGQALKALEGHNNTVNGALELLDGRLLSWSADGSLRLWSSGGQALATLQGHTNWVTGASVLSDGRFLSWSYDNTLRLWSSGGEALATLQGHTSSVTGASVLSDGRILSWSRDNTLRLWSSQGEPLAVYAGDAPLTCCVVTASGVIVVGDRQGRVLFLRLVE